MDKAIKIVQIGCGKMSKYTMRYAFEKGAKIVGALDINESILGKDIGFIMESDDKGVLIEDIKKLETLINLKKPDIAIITTMSLLNDLADILRICAINGVNVVTTCEEAFFASNSNKSLFKEIDVLAKANNCTITGCGYQDVFWGHLITTLAGSTHKITNITGMSCYNVEDYGIALAQAHGAGLSLEEFEKTIASIDDISPDVREKLIQNREFLPSYMWNTVGWIADKLGLNVKLMNQKCEPIMALEDIHSNTLGIVIPKGSVRGMSAVVTCETFEGITIEASCIGKVYLDTEIDINEWQISGEPDTTLTINQPATVELTCANIINRIPDIINAESGFVSTSKMASPKYLVKPMHSYLK